MRNTDSQVQSRNTNQSRNIATKGTPMIVTDDIIREANESDVLKFVLALWTLEHHNLNLRAEDEAVAVLKVSKNAFTQYVEGHGSIGPEGWEKLRAKFDLRPYDIWFAAMCQRYRKL